jgi:hypothetical protein
MDDYEQVGGLGATTIKKGDTDEWTMLKVQARLERQACLGNVHFLLLC